MSFLTLLLTSPLVLIANAKKQQNESRILLKLFGIWLLSLMYITINDNFRVPFGTICAILIVFKSKTNRNSKLAALLAGILSLLFSSLIYLLRNF
jgi:hypothetical protein